MRQKTAFSVVEMRSENVVLCLKMRAQIWEMRVQIWEMRAQIWGCLGQMAHRRQIAQWSGTRTTHPGGTGFEPRQGRFHQTRRHVANKVGGIQEDHPGGVASPGSRPVLAHNQGVSPRASRRGFFRPPNGFFGAPKGPLLLKT